MDSCSTGTEHTFTWKKSEDMKWRGPEVLRLLTSRFEDTGGMPQPVPPEILSDRTEKARFRASFFLKDKASDEYHVERLANFRCFFAIVTTCAIAPVTGVVQLATGCMM